MSRGRPITPKDPQEVIARYLSGETAKEIAQDFGYNDGHAVLKFLRDAGIPIRTRGAELAIRRTR